MLIMSCNLLSNLGSKVITPSNVTISENREVSGFTMIDFRTLGKVNILPGDVETLNISGPDNLVPEIITEVSNGTLIIRTKENLNINPLSGENPLTFTIVVIELTGIDVSGLGDVQLEALATPRFAIDMSGAGRVLTNQLTTDSLSIDLSGVGGVEISGEAAQATIEVSGAGGVNAPDLKTRAADVNISGLGSVTVWVTDQLTGDISGGGSVSYYGNPQTNTNSTGLGKFNSLGEK
jgi:hypothetical protein